jgi:hypothetical protein
MRFDILTWCNVMIDWGRQCHQGMAACTLHVRSMSQVHGAERVPWMYTRRYVEFKAELAALLVVLHSSLEAPDHNVVSRRMVCPIAGRIKGEGAGLHCRDST